MLKRTISYSQADIQTLLVQHLPSWECVSPQDIQLTRLAGLTNITYKAEVIGQTIIPQAVVFREFGHAEGFVDQKLEKVVFSTISELSLGPKEIYCGTNWRIEEFITESYHPTNEQIAQPEFQFKCMGLIERFHSIDVPLPNKKTSSIIEGVLSEKMKLNVLDKISQTYLFSQDELEKLNQIKTVIKDVQQQEFLRNMVDIENDEKLVFCHNDLNQLNIFKSEKNDREIVFIDYEYCSYNYPAFDIANFLNESAINYQYNQAPFYELQEDNQFSNVQAHFLSLSYLLHQKCDDNEIQELASQARLIENVNRDKSQLKVFQSIAENILRERYSEDDIVQLQMDIKHMKRRIRRFMIMSNLNWVYWSVLQSKQNIDFDHVNYGMMRLYVYKKLLREEQKRAGKASPNASSVISAASSDEI